MKNRISRRWWALVICLAMLAAGAIAWRHVLPAARDIKDRREKERAVQARLDEGAPIEETFKKLIAEGMEESEAKEILERLLTRAMNDRLRSQVGDRIVEIDFNVTVDGVSGTFTTIHHNGPDRESKPVI